MEIITIVLISILISKAITLKGELNQLRKRLNHKESDLRDTISIMRGQDSLRKMILMKGKWYFDRKQNNSDLRIITSFWDGKEFLWSRSKRLDSIERELILNRIERFDRNIEIERIPEVLSSGDVIEMYTKDAHGKKDQFKTEQEWISFARSGRFVRLSVSRLI